jgi:hypothetical protein
VLSPEILIRLDPFKGIVLIFNLSPFVWPLVLSVLALMFVNLSALIFRVSESDCPARWEGNPMPAAATAFFTTKADQL